MVLFLASAVCAFLLTYLQARLKFSAAHACALLCLQTEEMPSPTRTIFGRMGWDEVATVVSDLMMLSLDFCRQVAEWPQLCFAKVLNLIGC